jgi:serine/threonine protein kinase
MMEPAMETHPRQPGDDIGALLERFRTSLGEEKRRGYAGAAADRLFAEGSAAGDWTVLGFLARGGSSEVYCARHRTLGTPAVLKVLHRTETRHLERFRRETRFLRERPGASFPAFLDAGETEGRPWIAIEPLEVFPPPSGDDAVARYLLDVATGLSALHARGWLHRDVKPANILRRADGHAVLVDFGLLKKIDPEPDSVTALSVVDGRPVGVGTPGYAAPEQFAGGPATPATDVHALGCLADRCFGGHPPRHWERIIAKATHALPHRRYPSVAAMMRAIRLRHLRAWLCRAALALLAVAVGAVLLLRHRPPESVQMEPPPPAPATQAADGLPLPPDEPQPAPEPDAPEAVAEVPSAPDGAEGNDGTPTRPLSFGEMQHIMGERMRAQQEANASMREARQFMDEGSWAKGLRAAERGLELTGAETHPDPGRVECQYLLATAWYLLVVPDDGLRDPGRAARLAQIVRDAGASGPFMEIIDAALQFESGDTYGALETMARLTASGKGDDETDRQLRCYQAGRRYTLRPTTQSEEVLLLLAEADRHLQTARERCRDADWAGGLAAAEEALALVGAEHREPPMPDDGKYLLATAWLLLVVPDADLRDTERAGRLYRQAERLNAWGGMSGHIRAALQFAERQWEEARMTMREVIEREGEFLFEEPETEEQLRCYEQNQPYYLPSYGALPWNTSSDPYQTARTLAFVTSFPDD